MLNGGKTCSSLGVEECRTSKGKSKEFISSLLICSKYVLDWGGWKSTQNHELVDSVRTALISAKTNQIPNRSAKA